jgi:hypothetical protein
VTDVEKSILLKQIYSYTDRFVPKETLVDEGLLESVLTRIGEIDEQLREEQIRYEETLLLINALGESDGSTGSTNI